MKNMFYYYGEGKSSNLVGKLNIKNDSDINGLKKDD